MTVPTVMEIRKYYGMHRRSDAGCVFIGGGISAVVCRRNGRGALVQNNQGSCGNRENLFTPQFFNSLGRPLRPHHYRSSSVRFM